jgi:DNA-binding transcriptional MerR regulator
VLEYNKSLMHIGKLAKAAGTTTRTVRFYEEMGLIKPECRSEGGFRCYCHDQLIRLRMILGLKEMAFDLDQIKAILCKQDAHETGGQLAQDILGDLNIQLEEVAAQIAYFQGVHGKLAETIASICECLPCHWRVEERLCTACSVQKETKCQSVPFFHQVEQING